MGKNVTIICVEKWKPNSVVWEDKSAVLNINGVLYYGTQGNTKGGYGNIPSSWNLGYYHRIKLVDNNPRTLDLPDFVDEGVGMPLLNKSKFEFLEVLESHTRSWVSDIFERFVG